MDISNKKRLKFYLADLPSKKGSIQDSQISNFRFASAKYHQLAAR